MVQLNDGKRIKAQIWDTGSNFYIQLGKNNTDPSLLRTFFFIQSLPESIRRISGIRHRQA